MDSVIVTIRSRFQAAGQDGAAPHFRFTFSVIHDQPLFTFRTEIADPDPDNEAAMRKAAIFEFQVLMAELALLEDSAFIIEQ